MVRLSYSSLDALTNRADVILDGKGALSEVGSIEVQLFRKQESSEESETEGSERGKALRAPSFVDFPYWSDINSHVTSEGPPAQFEIGFVALIPYKYTVANSLIDSLMGRRAHDWSRSA